MSLKLNLQIASKTKSVPRSSQFRKWVKTVIAEHFANVELTIRIVGTKESAALNKKYRKKSKATNVLAFPLTIKPQFNSPLLGDIVICAPIVIKEAKLYNKDPLAHWAHIVIHGSLHLLGYNHTTNKAAIIMERLESEILQQLGYPPPYEDK